VDRDPIREAPINGDTRRDPDWRESATRDAAREYGSELAVVAVARAGRPDVDRLAASVPAIRPVRVVLTVVGAATTVGDVPGGDVEVLRLAEDIGRPAAINRAVAGLDAEVGWVLIADPAVRWDAGVLDGLLAVAARYPRAGLIGPRLRETAGSVLSSAGAQPSITQALRGRIPVGADAGSTGWLSTSCVLLRRAAWDSVDGFDPRYLDAPGPVDMADVDLADRLLRAGWLVVHAPGVEVATGTGFRNGDGVLAAQADGLRRYVSDRSGAPARLLLALATRPGVVTSRNDVQRNTASRKTES
jgi:N-acetylglucosaminyl-diphospho-decaprenol L-rhamnosyltransferase